MKRKKLFKWLALGLVVAAGAIYIPPLFSSKQGPIPPARSARLLTLAAEEAGGITDLNDRLTRQLNIADLQTRCGQNSEAIKTLALAVKTLQLPAKELDKAEHDDFRRIAGWTSVAELAHRAGDAATANAAYLDAVESLNSIKPETKRAEYVLSLAEICNTLRGVKEASQLLVKGGEWASKIEDTPLRRFALATFARQLTTYDDLEGARAVMKYEADARWRSDMFAALAQQNIAIEANAASHAASAQANGVFQTKIAIEADATTRAAYAKAGAAMDATREFNKNVHYESVYRSDAMQNGLVPQ